MFVSAAALSPPLLGRFPFQDRLRRKAALNHLGERGVVDLIGLLGYYNMVSMLLNVDRYPIPDGSQPELKAIQ